LLGVVRHADLVVFICPECGASHDEKLPSLVDSTVTKRLRSHSERSHRRLTPLPVYPSQPLLPSAVLQFPLFQKRRVNSVHMLIDTTLRCAKVESKNIVAG